MRDLTMGGVVSHQKYAVPLDHKALGTGTNQPAGDGKIRERSSFALLINNGFLDTNDKPFRPL